MGDKIGSLFKNTKAKHIQSLARLLSLIEEKGSEILMHKALLQPESRSFRLGITGPPGVGKSTLVGELISEFRKKNFSVGVIAVDPSSIFSKGAILGDRIRYSDHFTDEKVFIRSLGSRGSVGGLSASAHLMLRAFDIFGFDIILIETVGVGQAELDILHVADLISVVLTPESGDSIQAMKSGLIEIADNYIVNKSDRPGAEALAKELKEVSSQNKVLFSTVATQKKGIASWACFVEEKRNEFIKNYLNKSHGAKKLDEKISGKNLEKLKQEARALLREKYESEIEEKLSSIDSLSSFVKLF